ncbi:MAG: glycosyltransferase family 2 protein [Gammaproteobacteria bacterium]|nr:glycosyltransferase family 2 protein [Gammaproteobacteria bacterium]
MGTSADSRDSRPAGPAHCAKHVETSPACSAHDSHLVIIPSYNSGPKLLETVREARRYWAPVWVVIDGSTDGSRLAVEALAKEDPEIAIFALPHNQGKGAAILHGLRSAEAAGYSHVLTMDGDGQHPANAIPNFIAESIANPDALILGRPIFDASAPRIRVLGRKLSNWWTRVETLWTASFDSLFGFRVYPVAELRRVLEQSRWMRRFDFDAEAAVRLCWRGCRPISLPAPVQYFLPHEGGVSHFRYVRDNLLLTWMHVRLVMCSLVRLPALAARRLKSSPR